MRRARPHRTQDPRPPPRTVSRGCEAGGRRGSPAPPARDQSPAAAAEREGPGRSRPASVLRAVHWAAGSERAGAARTGTPPRSPPGRGGGEAPPPLLRGRSPLRGPGRRRRKRPAGTAAARSGERGAAPARPHLLVEGVDGVHVRAAAAAAGRGHTDLARGGGAGPGAGAERRAGRAGSGRRAGSGASAPFAGGGAGGGGAGPQHIRPAAAAALSVWRVGRPHALARGPAASGLLSLRRRDGGSGPSARRAGHPGTARASGASGAALAPPRRAPAPPPCAPRGCARRRPRAFPPAARVRDVSPRRWRSAPERGARNRGAGASRFPLPASRPGPPGR